MHFQLSVQAQWVDHSIEIYGTYGVSSPNGEKSIADNEFVLPSFYNNFNEATSITLGATYKILPYLSVGLEYNKMTLNDWSNDESSLFNNAEAAIVSLGPVLMFHSGSKKKEITKRFKFFVLAIPLILRLENTFQTRFLSGGPAADITEIESRDLRYGIRITPGIMYSINPKISVQIRSNITYSKVQGDLFNDSYLLFPRNEIGLVLKFNKDKRFYLNE